MSDTAFASRGASSAEQPRARSRRTFALPARAAVAGAILILSVASLARGQGSPLFWNELTPETSPTARYNHAMVYDSARKMTVLFGGINSGGGPIAALGDTWEYDGLTWRRRHPATSPPARFWHAMSYDSPRGVTVLFGGRSFSQEFNDVWEWNGRNWVSVTVSGLPPSPREGHGMVFDSVRNVHVMFGGYLMSTAQYSGETWEYNGTARTWTLRSSVGPAPRGLFGLAFDIARNETVLFGGVNGSSSPPARGDYLADTWGYSGGTGVWTLRNSSTLGLDGRLAHNMAYDSDRQVSLAQCGRVYFDSSPAFQATVRESWEWNGASWTDKTLSYLFNAPRGNAAMIYDSGLANMLLFGGDGYHPAGTWILTAETGLPVVYVDQANTGFQNGSEGAPFNTVQQGVNAAMNGATIYIKSADYAEGAKTYSKRVLLTAKGGTARIH